MIVELEVQGCARIRRRKIRKIRVERFSRYETGAVGSESILAQGAVERAVQGEHRTAKHGTLGMERRAPLVGREVLLIAKQLLEELLIAPALAQGQRARTNDQPRVCELGSVELVVVRTFEQGRCNVLPWRIVGSVPEITQITLNFRHHPCPRGVRERSEEHTSELQSHSDLVCRLLLEKKKRLIL